MVSSQIHTSLDPRFHKDRVVSTGTIELAGGDTQTTVSNLAVGKQSKIMHMPANASAWALYHDQTIPTTPIVATVAVRSFTLSHPAAAGGELIDYIVIAGDLV